MLGGVHMNISKYIDFTLEKGHSKKNDKDYYCICIKIQDKTFPIAFMNKDAYDLLITTLDK